MGTKKIYLSSLQSKLLYKKSLVILSIMVIYLVGIGSLNAQPNWQLTQYQAYLKNDTRLWHQSMKEVASASDQFSKSLAGYALLNATMASKNEQLFEEYLDETNDPLEEIIDKKGANSAEAKAVLAAIMGIKMAYAPWKGMFLGMKSTNYMSEAMKEKPQSYLVQKLYAGSKLYTPEAFGGDVNEAIKAFNRCIELMEAQPEHTVNNWMYLDALAHLGICYDKAGDPTKAKTAYQKALKVEPNFYWVSKVLLPSVQ